MINENLTLQQAKNAVNDILFSYHLHHIMLSIQISIHLCAIVVMIYVLDILQKFRVEYHTNNNFKDEIQNYMSL